MGADRALARASTRCATTTRPTREIKPQFLVQALYEATDGGDCILSSDVGQHQMWAAQYFHFAKPRRWINSGGLGTMGFGLPAAIGAAVACPDVPSVLLTGDGSFQMNIQELATARQYDIPVKCVIMDNGYLGMVRQWQELFWDRRYSNVDMGTLARLGQARRRLRGDRRAADRQDDAGRRPADRARDARPGRGRRARSRARRTRTR